MKSATFQKNNNVPWTEVKKKDIKKCSFKKAAFDHELARIKVRVQKTTYYMYFYILFYLTLNYLVMFFVYFFLNVKYQSISFTTANGRREDFSQDH